MQSVGTRTTRRKVKAPQLKESIQSGLAQSRRMLKWHTQFVASKIQIALENRDKQQKKALRSVEHQVLYVLHLLRCVSWINSLLRFVMLALIYKRISISFANIRS